MLLRPNRSPTFSPAITEARTQPATPNCTSHARASTPRLAETTLPPRAVSPSMLWSSRYADEWVWHLKARQYMWQFFDEIIRSLLYLLARVAGMPPRILDAYKRFQEGLSIHNTVLGGRHLLQTKVWGTPGGPVVHDVYGPYHEALHRIHAKDRGSNPTFW